MSRSPLDLLAGPLGVINVGLETFAEDLARRGVSVLHVAWTPPAGGDQAKAALLALLEDEDDDAG
jgi:hypothetical protein